MVIYITKNKINGKKYIGKDLKNDPKYLGSGVHLKRAILKYGVDNFIKEIIEYCDNIEQLNEKEKYWIDFFDATKSNDFYNIAKGGEGGNTISGFDENELIEYKKKISESSKNRKHKESSKKKISNARKNMICSDETKKRISESLKGKNKGKIPWNKGKKGLYNFTSEQKIKMSEKRSGDKNPSFGKKWMNKDDKNIYINKCDVNEFLEKGYKLGLLKK
jgi:group I intron endonuclease